MKRRRVRRGAAEPNVEVGGHRHRKMVEVAAFHDGVGGGPVHVTVEESADDAPVDHARKRLVLW